MKLKKKMFWCDMLNPVILTLPADPQNPLGLITLALFEAPAENNINISI